jgi:large subunit ribosomal protein L1
MAKLTKRQKAIAEKIEAGKAYNFEEAAALLAELPTAKFVESFDIAVNLGVDPRKSDQVVRSATVLPHGTGKTVRVAVFTQGPAAEAALAAGADRVGMDDLAAEMKGGDLNYDVVIASPDAMRVVGQLGQILGPRGLMPNPKVGTVNSRRSHCGEKRQGWSGSLPHRQKRYHPHFRWQSRLRSCQAEGKR